MSVIGTVESLWRYPVKSMRGEALEEIFVGTGGVRGDRLFAFRSSANREEFPYFTAREQRQMLRYRPRLQENDDTPAVETAAGEMLSLDDAALIEQLRSGIDPQHELTLLRSERAMTDARPVSLISLQTVRKLEEEIGSPTDKRQFRANIYLDLPNTGGFAENEWVGRTLRIGEQVLLSIVERDPRCMMITIDPDTAAKTPALLKQVAQQHGGTAGIYADVLVEGTIRRGDTVQLIKRA